MLNTKDNRVERRLYELALKAVCSPIRVIESEASCEELADYVAKLFNVDRDEHTSRYMPSVITQPCPVVLYVDVKRARNLPGEDQNGLSDPYCKVSVVYNPAASEEVNSRIIRPSPPDSPDTSPKRSSSLFSCVRSTTPKVKSKSIKSASHPRSMIDRRQAVGREGRTTLSATPYFTEVRPKTVDPEWNEHCEFNIENITDQYLQISVYDSDREEALRIKTIVQEKRGFARTMTTIKKFFATGEIDDDFLGQVTLSVESLAANSREQWFSLAEFNQACSNAPKSRGEIFLNLKVHFKLDEKKTDGTKCASRGDFSKFRRRHSVLESSTQSNASIILNPIIFRKHFRPSALKPRDYVRTTFNANDQQAQMCQNDSCLTPSTDSDSPLLIEEYHQLFRIVMLHELEDTRDKDNNQSDDQMIRWIGPLNELSYSVLAQFRVLYNIPILSEAFIQLLVILELRCSEEYANFISQAVIERFFKTFMDKVRKRSDINDLDFTDYEKTMFKEIFYMFIDHYRQRIGTDAPWFLPSKESLANIQTIADTICVLLELKICSNESLLRSHLEQTVKTRLRTDINASFDVYEFDFTNKQNFQLLEAFKFVDFVAKTNQSMPILAEYQRLFTMFNVNYINTCFFTADSAGDRLAGLCECLLMRMEEYFRTYSKPTIYATCSVFDSNLIDSSEALQNLYIYIHTIVEAIQRNFDAQDWKTNAFKLRLIYHPQWFTPMMTFVIEGLVTRIRKVLNRAVENNYQTAISEDEAIPYSYSPMAATRACVEICRAWTGLDYPEPSICYMAMIELTNTICIQCQHYARHTAQKLSENGYFTVVDRTRSFNVSRKLCILVNDVEFVKRNVLSALPELLSFSSVIEKMNEHDQSDGFKQIEITLQRLIRSAEEEMTDVIKKILEHVADLVHGSLRSKILTYYHDEELGKADCIEAVNEYIDSEVLRSLHDGLKDKVLYSHAACVIRCKVLQCLSELLPLKKPPEFYERVLQLLNELAIYFEKVCRQEADIPGPPCDEIHTFQRTLKTYALKTELLQLSYFKELCQVSYSLETSKHYGEIVFCVAYEINDDMVTVYAHIVHCRNLPKMDMFGTCDPYVILELLPDSFNHKNSREKQTKVKEGTYHPEYNETLQWYPLPMKVLCERGAILRLSVWDSDYGLKHDDFIGECFVHLQPSSNTMTGTSILRNIKEVKGVAFLRDVPAMELPLKAVHENNPPQSFELVRERKGFDEKAARCVKQRTTVWKSSHTHNKTPDVSQRRANYSKSAKQSVQQSIESNPGYRRWNLNQLKGNSINSSVETNDSNVS